MDTFGADYEIQQAAYAYQIAEQEGFKLLFSFDVRRSSSSRPGSHPAAMDR